jgi:hypothetical protein
MSNYTIEVTENVVNLDVLKDHDVIIEIKSSDNFITFDTPSGYPILFTSGTLPVSRVGSGYLIENLTSGNTIVRTFGNQLVSGIKTFNDNVIISGYLATRSEASNIGASHFPVFISDPSTFARNIHTRTPSQFKSDLAINNVQNVALTGVNFSAGSGLIGGGNLSSSRDFNVGQGDGLIVSADNIAVDSTVVRTSGEQTLSGGKTFSGTGIKITTGAIGIYRKDILLKGNTGTLFNNTVTITPTNNLYTDRVYYLPEAGVDADFVMTAGSQIITGQKTFTSTVIFNSGTFQSLKLGGIDVSVSGHTHTSSNITDFNTSVSGLVNGIYAPLSSPSFSGVPLTPTATAGTNSTQIASTAFVRTEISNLVASAPTALDTLNELATALGNDANFSTTVTNNLAGKANLSGATFTGSISSPSGNFTSLTVSEKPVINGGYDYEIHVSQIDGNDTTGNGDLLNPVASITKALTLVGSQRKTIIVHPGTYTENPSITVQYTTITGPGLIGGNILLSGTLSTNTGCTIAGIKMTNLTIATPTGAGNVNILNCEISGTLTKSSNADYTVLRLCDYGSASITGAGLVAIFGGNPNFTTVNNAGANVIIKSAVTVAPVLTSGTLSLVDSIVVAAVTNAITSAASSVITLANCQMLTSALSNVAPVVLSGFYSILNCVFDKPNSTLIALSATGGPTNSIDYFQYINADKFITQGGTSSQYVKGDGSLALFPDNIVYTSGNQTISGVKTFSDLPFVNGTGVSISGHTHTSSNITDFNSSVSGLLPVKNIISGTDIAVSNSSGTYTISSTASGVPQIYSTVFNNTGSPIPKMSAVYINGGQGDMPTVALSIADSESTSSKTYAVTTEAISNMSSGRVVVSGPLTALNTDQFNPTSPHGNVNGTTVWLSPTVSGGLTTTKPSAPYHMVAIGTIVRTHQNQGIIEVKIQNGFELHELHNVAINGVTNGQFLQYNSGSGLWLASSSGNFSTLNVNGTGVSISGHTHTSSNITDFNSSVSGLLPVGTSNYLSKFGTGGSGLSNSLIFDNGTNVGIGTASPTARLHVVGSGVFSSGIIVGDSSTNSYIYGPINPSTNNIRFNNGGADRIDFNSSNLFYNGVSYFQNNNFILRAGETTSTASQKDSYQLVFQNALWDGTTSQYATSNIRSIASTSQNLISRLAFFTHNSVNNTLVERMCVTSSGGYVGIGTTTPSSQLHVIGTGIFSSGIGVGINTPLDLIHVSGSSANAQGIRIDNGDGQGGSIQADNGALYFKSPTATAFRVQAAKIRLGDGASSTAIELTSNGSISQDGNGGGLTFSGTTAQFSNGINVTNSGIFGSVGIGTSSPSKKLDVIGDARVSGVLNLVNASDSTDRSIAVTSNNMTFAGVHGIFEYSVGLRGSRGSACGLESNATNGYLALAAGGSEKVRIATDGKVGIGITTPSGQLHVVGTGLFTSIDINNSVITGQGALTVNGGIVTQGAFVRSSSFGIYEDNNTKIYKDEASALKYSVSSSSYRHSFGYDVTGTHNSWMVIGSSGVGIGTTAPQELLHVSGTISSSAGNLLRLNNSSATTNPSINFRIGGVGNYDSHFFISRNGTDVFGIDTNNRGVFLSSFSLFGNQSFLSYNNSNALIKLQNTTTNNLEISAVSGILFQSQQSTKMRMDQSGNFGIGTTTPSAKLDVNGNVNIDGNLTFDSFTESVVAIGNSSTSQTISLTSGTVQTCTLTDNCTFTMPTATAGKSFSLFLNTGSGGFTATFTGVRWSDSTSPTITSTASKVDLLSFISDGSFWYGSFSQNYG